MKSNASREAFLRSMGISHNDTIHPDEGSSRQSQSSKAKTFFQASADNSYSANYKAGAENQETNAWKHLRSAPSAANTAANGSPSVRLKTSAQVQDEVEQLKKAGNDAFERGHFAEAVRLYTQAITQSKGDLEDASSLSLKTLLGGRNAYDNPVGSRFNSIGPPNSTGASKIFLATLFSNRSAAFMQAAHDTRVSESPQGAYQSALGDAEQAAALRPDWFKPYSRQGDAHFKLRQYHQAAEAYQMALHLQPGNILLAKSLKESQERIKSTAMEKINAKRQPGKDHSGAAKSQDNMTSQNAEPKQWMEFSTPSLANPHETASVSAKLDSPQMQNKPNSNSQHRSSAFSPRNQNKSDSKALCTAEEYRQSQLEEFRRKREARLKGSSADDVFSDKTFNSARVPRDGLTQSMSITSPDMSRSKCQSTTLSAIAESLKSPNNTKSMNSISENSNYESTFLNDKPTKNLSVHNIPYVFSSEAAAAYQQELLKNFREKNAKKR